MKSWNKDWNIPAFLIFNIILFAGIFYFDLHRSINVGSFEPIGTVSFKINSILRKFDSSVVWYSIQTNSPLANKDTIKTYPESDAMIHLNNGTEIRVDEDTMIYLDYSGNKPSINFEGGNIQINSSNSKDKNNEINVKTKDKTITLSGGDAKIGSGNGDDVSITVDKGSATIEGGGVNRKINENEIATISKSGISTRKLPYSLIEPENQRKFIATSTPFSVNFKWAPTGSHTEPTFELSRVKDFKRVDTRLKNVTSANLSLAAGVYYWRVGGKNESGQIEYSDSKKFILIKEVGLKLFSPASGANVASSSSGARVTFSWTPSETVSDYVVDISNSPDFAPILRSVPVGTNTISMGNFTEGTYYWRVTTKPATGIPSIRSNPSSFSIGTPKPQEAKVVDNKPILEEKQKEEKQKEEAKKVEEAKKAEAKKVEESIAGIAPEHLSPSSGKIDITKSKQIHFKWDKVKNAAYYILKIAPAEKKGNTLISERTSANGYTLKNFSKFSEGTFLWEVTPFDKKNNSGKTSRGKFTIDLSDDGLKNLKPEEIKILSPDTIYRDK